MLEKGVILFFLLNAVILLLLVTNYCILEGIVTLKFVLL
jgi:hypothetical protein